MKEKKCLERKCGRYMVGKMYDLTPGGLTSEIVVTTNSKESASVVVAMKLR